MTNTASCNSVSGGSDTCIGLFPVFSLLSHSCVANTRRLTDGGTMKVIATVPISAGDQIFTSYKNPLLGSVSRRCHFPRIWYFDCQCRRCCDATELGTHLSSLRCDQCGGTMVTTHPTSYHSPYQCVTCHMSLSCHQVMTLNIKMYRALVTCPDSVPDILSLISHLENIAHTNHYIIIQAKIKFVMMSNVTDQDILEQQVTMCQDVLAVLDVVEPGLTKRRGQMFKQLALTKLKLLKINPASGFEMMKQMKQLMMILKEAGKCNQFDSKEDIEEWTKTIRQSMMVSARNG